MRLKLDENIGRRGAALLRAHGHDVATVLEQGMGSASDAVLIEACRSERRCLVTLDLDFANPIGFPPSRYCGIAVLRPRSRIAPSDLDALLATLAAALAARGIDGLLWIVERGRIREYSPDS